MLITLSKRTSAVLTLWIVSSFLLTGCRSMPGRNLFSWRSEPSAEALAGTGPTATFPVSPSAGATPEAIASVAGGTAVPKSMAGESMAKQATGIEIQPGYAVPASADVPATNQAAAQANGFYSGAAQSSYAATSPTAKETKPLSGYTFGTKALTPKQDSRFSSLAKNMAPSPKSSQPGATATASLSNGSSYNAQSSFTPPAGSSFQPPSQGFTPPSGNSFSLPETNTAPENAMPRSSGFTFPESAPRTPQASSSGGAAKAGTGYGLNGFEVPSPAVAALTPPAKPAGNRATVSDLEKPESAAAVSGIPDFSTASVAPPTAPTSRPSPTKNYTVPSSGYSPGSTGSTSGYPTKPELPTETGSFFR